MILTYNLWVKKGTVDFPVFPVKRRNKYDKSTSN